MLAPSQWGSGARSCEIDSAASWTRTHACEREGADGTVIVRIVARAVVERRTHDSSSTSTQHPGLSHSTPRETPSSVRVKAVPARKKIRPRE
ncbi:hypothetical protein MTO96_002782 [Rhipicephalus appendiculatus]